MTFPDRLKELTIYLVTSANVQHNVTDNKHYPPHGVAYAKRFSYSAGDLYVTFDKWVVDNFETASKMELDGCKYNGRLIGGVTVLSKKLGSCMFYGEKAKEIVSACERGSEFDVTQSFGHDKQR